MILIKIAKFLLKDLLKQIGIIKSFMMFFQDLELSLVLRYQLIIIKTQEVMAMFTSKMREVQKLQFLK